MSDIQGALKELIIKSEDRPPPWKMQPGNGRPTQLKKARPAHKMMVSMHLAGFRDHEIAEQLGYTVQRVGMILRSKHPDLLAHREETGNMVSRQLGDLVLRFRAESSKSLDVLVEIRDKVDNPVSERRQSALAILDRAGYSPVKKQVNMDLSVPVQELNSTLQQIQAANEVVEKRNAWVIKDLPVTP